MAPMFVFVFILHPLSLYLSWFCTLLYLGASTHIETPLESLLVYSYSKKFIAHAKGMDVVAGVSEDWLINWLVTRFYKVQGMPNIHPWIRIEIFGCWIFRKMVTLSFVIVWALNNLVLCFSQKKKKFVTVLGYMLTKPALLCPIWEKGPIKKLINLRTLVSQHKMSQIAFSS